MKAVALVALAVGARAAQLQTTPMSRVASLLIEMRARIESDGKKEQMSYDKYACWCEDTLGRKAGDISEAKRRSEQLQTRITELGGELGSHGAEIKQLKTDIAANLESQRDANSVRAKENGGYEGEKTETEQCVGALEAAIKVLTGAGTGGFLETMKEVQLLSVVSGVRGALSHSSVSKSMSSSDLTLVNNFFEHPEDFVGKRAGSMMSAAQITNNPFGDYAPQSTQIQGILRGMYEAFTRDLEKDNAAEANAQKAFEELMETKRQELETLQATLGSQQSDHSRKSLDRDTSREELDDTQTQLATDEKFFDTTKAGCKEKAQQWSVRSSLRAQELAGVNMAVSILTSPDARRIFTASTTTFVQLGSVTNNANDARLGASAQLARLAQKYHSLSLAKVAVEVQSAGHFDKVIATVDQMIAALRKEEQDDIAHRDRCQNAEGKNSNGMEDLNEGIHKAGTTIENLQGVARDLGTAIETLDGKIQSTKDDMKSALDLRNDAVADFKQAVKDDTQASALLDQTIVALSEFYRKNKIPMSLSQKDPVYSVDADKAPETSWADEKYGGRNQETHGVVAILRMLKEDVQKEIATSREDNAAAEAQYEKEKAELQDTLNAQRASKVATERQLGQVQEAIHEKTKSQTALESDLQEETTLKSVLDTDCSWVASHFESRRDKRKAEINGLIDAKGYLGGAEDGSMV